MFEAEFTRFKGGHIYTLTFDSDGRIQKAMIYIQEIDKNLDITSFVKDDAFWQSEVDYWLYEYKETANERKYFSAYKDASNE